MSDLTVLHDRWDDCEKCSIASNHKVHYRGSKSPTFLFIADTPSLSDTVLKKPMSGQSGKLLDQIVRECGLKKKHYGVTTLIGCMSTARFRPSELRCPSKDEAANCLDRFDDIVETYLAKYYITLGPDAKRLCPSSTPISVEFTSPHKWVSSGGEMSLSYKRNRHQLKKFLKDISW